MRGSAGRLDEQALDRDIGRGSDGGINESGMNPTQDTTRFMSGYREESPGRQLDLGNIRLQSEEQRFVAPDHNNPQFCLSVN